MITKHVLSALLFLVIAVQICCTKPAPENTDTFSQDLCLQETKYKDTKPSEIDNFLSPSSQLLKFTIRAFQDLALQYVKKAKHISGNLLKNMEISTSKSAKISEFKRNLSQFEERYSLCDSLEELFELVELYSNTTSYYFGLEEATLDADNKLILNLLQKYGSKDLDEESMNIFNGLVDKFNKKFEDLKENLSTEEGKIGKKIIEWFSHFKTSNNFYEKIVAFGKFFELFDEE